MLLQNKLILQLKLGKINAKKILQLKLGKINSKNNPTIKIRENQF